MAVADGKGLPIGLSLHPSRLANRSKLIEPTLDTIRVPRIGACRPRTKIKRLIYDRAADYASLRVRLKEERGIDLICPHRKIANIRGRIGENSPDIKGGGLSNVPICGY